jgi:hypothetical protein
MKSFKHFLIENATLSTAKTNPVVDGVDVKTRMREMEKVKQLKGDSNQKQDPINSKEEDDPFGGNEQVKRLYGAIVGAEHEGEQVQNPFEFNQKLYIRTRAGGGASSAYGPTQITRNTARGFLKTQPELFKDIQDYTQQFIDQGSKFLSADPKDTTYGLGCVGDLCDPKYHSSYQKLSAAIIRGKAKEKKIDLDKPISDSDLNNFIGWWRGATEKDDPRYFKAFRERFKTVETPQQPQKSSSRTTPVPPNTSTSQTSPSR